MKLKDHAQRIAVRENCYLYDLEVAGAGRGRILRVYIDKEGAEGVSIDDCSRVSRGLDLVLDVEDLIPGGSYQLEVSSPGLDRHLSESWHFQKVVGQSISLQLNKGLGEIEPRLDQRDEKRKKIVGELVGADDKTIEMKWADCSLASVKIPYENINRARVVFSHEQINKKKPKK